MRSPAVPLFAALTLASCGGTDKLTNVPPGQPANLSCASGCTGDQICVVDTCQDAFSRFYTVTIRDAVFAQRKPNGQCWNAPGCSAPDPVIKLYVNDQKVAQTHTKTSTYQTTFGESFDVYLAQGDKLEIVLYGAGLINDEPAAGCALAPITADELRMGNLDCANGDDHFTATIAVRTRGLLM